MPITILRTAAGSAPSVSQYRLFKELGLRVIAADADPLSVGFAFADAAYRVARADSDEYVSCLISICERENVDWILPALDEELLLLARTRREFESRGTRVLTSGLACLETCVDKLRTHEFFVRHGIPTPDTLDAGSLDPASVRVYPQIVKPRRGRGSSHIYVAREPHELSFFARYVPNAIVQRFVAGREMTIDALADFGSTPLFISPRYRLQTDSGISYKGATAWEERVVAWTAAIVRQIGLIGPANIQCIVDEDGGVWFTEVNARLAGSAVLTFSADPEFPRALVDLLLGRNPAPSLRPPKPLVMLRYWSEAYLEPEQVAHLYHEV